MYTIKCSRPPPPPPAPTTSCFQWRDLRYTPTPPSPLPTVRSSCRSLPVEKRASTQTRLLDSDIASLKGLLFVFSLQAPQTRCPPGWLPMSPISKPATGSEEGRGYAFVYWCCREGDLWHKQHCSSSILLLIWETDRNLISYLSGSEASSWLMWHKAQFTHFIIRAAFIEY